HGDFRLHAATTKEDGFKGFRNTVSANLFGTVTSHKADNQSADRWNENDIITEMVLIRRLKYGGETLIEGDTRYCRDQPNQRIGDHGHQHADDTPHPRENNTPPIPRKIRQPIFDPFYNLIHLINTSLITYLSRQRTPSVVKIKPSIRLPV